MRKEVTEMEDRERELEVEVRSEWLRELLLRAQLVNGIWRVDNPEPLVSEELWELEDEEPGLS